MEITFVIPGDPVGKQRPVVNTMTHFAYTPKKTKNYENWVRMCYCQDYKEPVFPDRKPIWMHIDAYYQIPKSASYKKSVEMEEGKIKPVVKPDLDNICKTVCDALNKVAYRDDSCIVGIVLEKMYTRVNPRVIVKISDEGVV